MFHWGGCEVIQPKELFILTQLEQLFLYEKPLLRAEECYALHWIWGIQRMDISGRLADKRLCCFCYYTLPQDTSTSCAMLFGSNNISPSDTYISYKSLLWRDCLWLLKQMLSYFDWLLPTLWFQKGVICACTAPVMKTFK